MRLYLLRHATAADTAASDAERPLTSLGREEARHAGRALARLGCQLSHILSSPLLRARQTAELCAAALPFPCQVTLIEELKNDATTAALLRTLPAAPALLLVGHMPSLAEHLASLIGAKHPENFPLGKGSIACVELDQLRPSHAQLRWLMRQKQLQKIAGA